jgi:tRNA pseudouridine55 synthase
LAEGVLLMASGEDVGRKEEFLGLDKEYDFVSIFGFATDTYDILGKILRVEKLEDMNEMDLIKIAKIYEGEREQEYPKYSSKMIARTLKAAESDSLRSQDASHISLQEHSLPLKKITIHKMQFHKMDTLNSKELFGRLLMDITKVKGDFRQHEILVLWKQILFGSESKDNFLGKFSAHVSSGTYIRSIVNDMGNTLGCGATTLSIKRTRVGDYKIEDSIK